MSLLSSVTVKNFKCFRESITFPLSQGNYFIGVNNAGKTAILNAVNFFFDNSLYDDEGFLNRTEYLAKKGGYNRCEIIIAFDLSDLTSKALKNRLIKLFGSRTAPIKKITIYTPESKRFSFNYVINGKSYSSFDDLDGDVKKLLESVKIIYIHPQEGKELLANAQEKLKQRLLANWGRNARLSNSIKELQVKWDELSKQASTYLSASLTENLQKMWPGSEVSIDLPKSITNVVAISDITFKGQATLPEIELNSQGTGAQSSVLYLTHYLLDSDRSLHRGEYHPIWLLEEPESFLHADLVIKFGTELNSESWLKNIQILVSTHSPLILATSRLGEDDITWNLISNHGLENSKVVGDWTSEEIDDIGKIMGDINFHVYFSAAKKEIPIFIEDSKEIVKDKFLQADVYIEQGLRGVPEIVKYIDVLINSPVLVKGPTYFIADNDKGLTDLVRFLPEQPEKKSGGFSKYKVKDTESVYVITLPADTASEGLFSEFDLHLSNCVNDLWNTQTWQFKETIPSSLSRLHGKIRNKTINSVEEGKHLIKNFQDVKELFWKRVSVEDLSMDEAIIKALRTLII